jgi:hypothetical protein
MSVTRASSFALGALAAFSLLPTGCGSEDDGIQNPARDQYVNWEKVELPNTVCGNGTQYKFFVKYSDKTDNLVVVFEPGGACWDYPSCSGAAGIRGAANPDGIPDDHYELAPFISPFLQREDPTSPTADWNMVYVPYCTGDVHTGNNVITYTDETGGGPDLEFHHNGHNNVQAVIGWIDQTFTHVPKMLSTGCSAGGAGAITNYYFLRNGVTAAQQGYLLDDSGPIFPSTGYSSFVHAKIRSSWNVDSILDVFPSGFDVNNFGSINTALADAFPDDRLATTFFRRDMNFSLYSYERFYEPPPSKEEALRMWDADTQLLVAQYETRDNLAYYIPYWRKLNDSHCTTVINFVGSEIQDQGLDLGTWTANLLDDSKPLTSAIEAPVPGEDTE